MKLIGIDNIKGDVLVGIGIGVSLIFANLFGLFSMAIPPVLSFFATNVGRFMIIVLMAPIIEEIVFRGVLLNFGHEISKNFILANIIQATAFGLFHIVAYSGIFLEEFSLSGALIVGGAFLSAIIFGLLVGFIAKKTNNLLPGIMAHAIINLWLVRGVLVVI